MLPAARSTSGATCPTVPRMSRPIHFEIHATDPQRAMAFYKKVFGWSFKKFTGSPLPYWQITTGPDDTPGINGGLHPRIGPKPKANQAVIAYVCTVPVHDLDVMLAKATAAGASLCKPEMQIPGVGRLAYVQDTEKNLLGLLQPESGLQPEKPRRHAPHRRVLRRKRSRARR